MVIFSTMFRFRHCDPTAVKPSLRGGEADEAIHLLVAKKKMDCRAAKRRIAMTAMIVFLLTGCSSISDTLGLGRNPPDEFAVVDRPPLSRPPNFDLQPPRPGAPRPQEQNATSAASAELFIDEGDPFANVDASNTEKALLEAAKTEAADPDIRDKINREAAQMVQESSSFVDDILWWRKPEANATVVDAAAESDRVRESQAANKPLDATPTPVIKRNESDWLGL